MQSAEVANVEYLEALHDQGAWELAKRVAELEAERDAERDALTARVADYQRMLASGFLYTYDQAARRDLLKQAEAFELAAETVSNAGCAYKLVERADDLRQQAAQLKE